MPVSWSWYFVLKPKGTRRRDYRRNRSRFRMDCRCTARRYPQSRRHTGQCCRCGRSRGSRTRRPPRRQEAPRHRPRPAPSRTCPRPRSTRTCGSCRRQSRPSPARCCCRPRRTCVSPASPIRAHRPATAARGWNEAAGRSCGFACCGGRRRSARGLRRW